MTTIDAIVAGAEEKCHAGDLRGAYADLLGVFARTRDHGRAHHVMAMVAARSGDSRNAHALVLRALEIDGENPVYLTTLAQVALIARDRVPARHAALRAAAYPDLPAEALATLSNVFHALALYEESLAALERLVRLDPANAVALANLGAVQVVCGHRRAALASLAAAIRIDPANMDAYANVSAARRARPDDNNVAVLRRLLAASDDPYRRVKLGHALARELDDLGRFDESFEALSDAKRAYPSRPRFDFGLFGAIDRADRLLEDVPSSTCTAEPLFIIGVPRSGTTLVERVVTNATGIVSLGESTQMLEHCDIAHVDRWPARDFQRIGEAYAAYASAFAPDAPRTVDKLPLNLLLVPAILKALPRARILCVLRHPMDTIIGNFRLLFSLDVDLYRYSSNLEDTARFVAAAHGWMRTLERRYPDNVRIVDYEALIAGPATVARPMTDFCGIAWRNDLVAIERNATPAGSASAGQVRTAIHRDFQGRWRHYERHLEPAKAILDENAIAWR